MSSSRFHLFCAHIVCGSLTAAALAQARPIALPGQQAPGLPHGVTFSLLTSPALSDNGHLAFLARLQGPGVDETNDSAYYLGTPDDFRLVVRKGDAAPGIPDARFGGHFVYVPNVSPAGDLLFRTDLTGPGINFDNADSTWIVHGDSMRLIARKGDPAPGLPAGTRYANLSQLPGFNAAGQFAFSAAVAGPGVDSTNSSACFAGTLDSLKPVFRRGDPAPGESNLVIDSFSCVGPSPGGKIVSYVPLRQPGVLGPQGYSLVTTTTSGGLRRIARTGQPAPGTEPGTTFDPHFVADLNANGDVVFIAQLAGLEVNMTNYAGIWAERNGAVQLLLRSGAHAPGTPDGVNFINFSPVVMNNSGEIAFAANLTGPSVNNSNVAGLWAGRPDNLRLLGRMGDPAPGTGVNFDQLFYTDSGVINDLGQVAVLAAVNNRTGIWFDDADGGPMQLVIWEGLPFEVAPGDWRTPTQVTFMHGPNDAGKYSSFNDRGELAFEAQFTDGTRGIFLYTVPEPAAPLLAAAVLALAATRRGA